MLTVCIAVITLCSIAVAPALATEDATGSFEVILEKNGDADVLVTLTFDLDDGDDQEVFESLQNDEGARSDFRDRFENRMASVAADAAAETGREMSVSDASIDLYTAGDIGVVELSVRWHGMAAVEDETITVTNPFASGFTPEQQFVIVGPEGYEVETATPAPDEQNGTALMWDAGTDLEGFEATFAAPAETQDGETESEEKKSDEDPVTDETPGFGTAIALVALSITALLAIRTKE